MSHEDLNGPGRDEQPSPAQGTPMDATPEPVLATPIYADSPAHDHAQAHAPAYAPAPALAPAPRRRARFVAWWLLASLAISVICAICLVTALGHIGDNPMHVIVNGEEVGNNLDITLGTLPMAHKVALVSAIVLAVTILLLVVPLVIMLVVGAVAIALVAGLGVPLLALALAFVVVSSPFWLVGGGIWLIVRANRRAAAMAAGASPSATIHA